MDQVQENSNIELCRLYSVNVDDGLQRMWKETVSQYTHESSFFGTGSVQTKNSKPGTLEYATGMLSTKFGEMCLWLVIRMFHTAMSQFSSNLYSKE
jgi:hypothetical protein